MTLPTPFNTSVVSLMILSAMSTLTVKLSLIYTTTEFKEKDILTCQTPCKYILVSSASVPAYAGVVIFKYLDRSRVQSNKGLTSKRFYVLTYVWYSASHKTTRLIVLLRLTLSIDVRGIGFSFLWLAWLRSFLISSVSLRLPFNREFCPSTTSYLSLSYMTKLFCRCTST